MKTFKEAQMEKALNPEQEANLYRCYEKITNDHSVLDEWSRSALMAIIQCAPVVVRRNRLFGVVYEGWFPKEDEAFLIVGIIEGTNSCAITDSHHSLWEHLKSTVIEDEDLFGSVWEKISGESDPERLKVNSYIGDLATVSFWDFKNEKWGLAARHMFRSNLVKHYRQIKDSLAVVKGTPT